MRSFTDAHVDLHHHAHNVARPPPRTVSAAAHEMPHPQVSSAAAAVHELPYRLKQLRQLRQQQISPPTKARAAAMPVVQGYGSHRQWRKSIGSPSGIPSKMIFVMDFWMGRSMGLLMDLCSGLVHVTNSVYCLKHGFVRSARIRQAPRLHRQQVRQPTVIRNACRLARSWPLIVPAATVR